MAPDLRGDEPHLLKTFIAAGNLGAPQATNPSPGVTPVTAEGVMWQTIIHGVFILSALGIAFTDRVMLPSAQIAKPKH